jgi:two-component system sensor histidine kinase KdpD
MLDEGHRYHDHGSDVVVAVVDTHGRPVTAARTAGLEVIPPKIVQYRGAIFEEMDLDAVLARRPDIALIDELAHTNVPTSGRNEKRWQDVLDLLAAGISVISTVNIQHVESLADVVERISGITVRERVPDAVLRMASLAVVDSSAELLRHRVLTGDVYLDDRALNGFFRASTLDALRELTMRFVAGAVDIEFIDELAAAARTSIGVSERVLVGLTADADDLLKWAAGLATRLKADLYAVHVRTGLSRKAEALQTLAGDLGAQWHYLDGDPAGVLIDFALRNKITRIVLGRSNRSRWQHLTGGGSTVLRVTQRAMAAGIDLYIVAGDER